MKHGSKNYLIFVFGLLLLFAQRVLALPISFQTYITDAAGDAVSEASLTVHVKILSPNNCILRAEVFPSSTIDEGNLSLSLLSGTLDTYNPNLSDDAVFDNSTVRSNLTCLNADGTVNGGITSYSPSANDTRKVRLDFVLPSNSDAIALNFQLQSVAYAMNAKTLDGKAASNFLNINTASGVSLSQANLNAAFTGAAYTNLQTILAGNFMRSDTSGAALPGYAATPGGVAAGDIWYDTTTNQVKYHNGTSAITLGSGGSGITSLTVGSSMSAGGTVAGTLNGPGTIDLSNTGVTAGTYQKVTVDSQGRVSAGAALVEADIPNLVSPGKVTGNAITSGTISGSTDLNTSGSLVTTSFVKGSSIKFTNGAYSINMTAPALGSNINLTLPPDAGAAGQVLATDGAGILSWITAGGASLPSLADGFMWIGNGVNAATPVSMSGDATINNAGVLSLNTVPINKGGTGTTTIGINKIVGSNGTGSAYVPVSCTVNQVISFDGAGNYQCSNVSAIYTPPAAGTDKNVMFNNSGAIGGATMLNWDNTNNWLAVGVATPTAPLHVQALGTLSGAATATKITGVLGTGNPTMLLVDATDAGSTSTAMFMNLRFQGASKFSVNRDGWVGAAGVKGLIGLPLQITADTNQNIDLSTTGTGDIILGGSGIINPTVQMQSADGSAGAPAYSFFSDSTMGMFRHLGTNLAFSTGGSPRMVIDSIGNVGINNTAPTVALDVNGQFKVGSGPASPISGFYRMQNVVWNGGIISANTNGTMAIAVTGAAVGDSAICNPRGVLPNGASMYCFVSAANSVTVAITNHTGTAMSTLGTIYFDIMVIK